MVELFAPCLNKFLLHCMDLSSNLRMLEADEKPWMRGLLMAFLEERRSFNGLPFFKQSPWKIEATSFHSEEAIL